MEMREPRCIPNLSSMPLQVSPATGTTVWTQLEGTEPLEESEPLVEEPESEVLSPVGMELEPVSVELPVEVEVEPVSLELLVDVELELLLLPLSLEPLSLGVPPANIMSIHA